MRGCGGPEHCVDDMCANSDQGICGLWRSDLSSWGEEPGPGDDRDEDRD